MKTKSCKKCSHQGKRCECPTEISERAALSPSDETDCSVGRWVRPDDAEWAEWNSLDDTILVLTTEGLRLVEVPEEYYPRYDNGDPVGDDPEQFWDAWCRVDPPRNAEAIRSAGEPTPTK